MPTDQEQFFVGYLPTPVTLRRVLLLGVLALALLAAALAVALPMGQRDPGQGVWDLDHPTSLEGIAFLTPCPLIRVVGPDGAPVSILLVDQGKSGARARLANLDRQAIRVHGHMLTHARVRMLELDDGSSAIQSIPNRFGSSLQPRGRSSSWERVHLRGEIVDPKCFAGAMKPGDGKTHKACAALCLRGGIPPMFIAVRDDHFSEYLIVDATGNTPSGIDLATIISHVGDWIQIDATVTSWADLRLVQVSAIMRK